MAFCKNCNTKIKELLKKLDKQLVKHVDTALRISTALKKVLDSELAQIAVTLILGDLDNELRARAINALEFAIKSLNIYKDFDSWDYASVQQLKHKLNELPEPQKEAILIKLASLITKDLDGRYGQAVYDSAAQLHYTLNKA